MCNEQMLVTGRLQSTRGSSSVNSAIVPGAIQKGRQSAGRKHGVDALDAFLVNKTLTLLRD